MQFQGYRDCHTSICRRYGTICIAHFLFLLSFKRKYIQNNSAVTHNDDMRLFVVPLSCFLEVKLFFVKKKKRS
jgi:hypothetical protein